MSNRSLRRSALSVALGLCLASLLPLAQAASNDGSLTGRVAGSGGQAVAGASVVVRNTETGLTRSVRADANGEYRFPFLPIGRYAVEVKQEGFETAQAQDVRVSLGNATSVNVTLAAMATLEAVSVVGSTSGMIVDVSSTESAMNVTKAELDRLPVERSAQAVALLAPGVTTGAFGGISFGGSSVAENTVYINGLNVTDFYRRIGFSSVPFSFFKEFQVKTGGYSVEFGRTTGGVINAVTQSGSNEFKFGTEATWEPSFLQTEGSDKYNPDGSKVSYQYDEYDRASLNAYASGPLVPDKLFFYVMYEARHYTDVTVTNDEAQQFRSSSPDDFWGAKLDWQVADGHLLELFAFSDKNRNVRNDYVFDGDTGERGAFSNRRFTDSGGTNYALTYTGYLSDTFSMKFLAGGNERDRVQKSLNDIDCSRIRDRRSGGGDVGCTTSGLIEEGRDERKAYRLDFEWSLADHLLRFGLDREENTSDNVSFYPGPRRLLYEIFTTSPGATLANGGVVPAGVTAYVRGRQQEVSGTFETLNTAYYLEDNWSVTPRLTLNLGLRLEGFDNKNGEGDTYIKMDDMLAPRLGLSWDLNGDGRSKLFANAGRYFLPVSNIINVKQAGAFLDRRTFWAFAGFEPFQYNGQTYQNIVFGPQIGPVDDSQGDGTVGDLRGEVDKDTDAVYQDEFLLGFQSMIDDHWGWGARGIYRKLHNAIDDMELTSNGILCDGEPGSIGYVMGNPGRNVTVYTDTNCDGDNDGYVTIDTSRAGWALYDDDGNYVGERGWTQPKRTYKALELQLDRAWDGQWSMNASYTLSYSRGNAEGPVNTDTGFSDTGRTEHFDDPFVDLDAEGPLPNDHRHQIKLRGAYALSESWRVGGTLTALSGAPISGLGVGNPYDGTNYHSFYICVQNCTAENPSERVYRLSPRGSYGRLPWTYDVGASISYARSFGEVDLGVTLAVYNLFNGTRVKAVDQDLQTDIGDELNPTFRYGTDYQSPRYAQLKVKLDF